MRSTLDTAWFILAGIIGFFLLTFVLKIAAFDWLFGQSRPRGFEVKLTELTTVPKQKENDHG